MAEQIKRSNGRQLSLFPLPLREFDFLNVASARTHYGAAVEEIACHLLGIHAIDTDARFKTCYDAERDGVFYEMKSVKRVNGVAIIFKKRLDNDKAAGVPLFYVFVSHNVTGAKTNRQLWSEMARTVGVVRVVPFHIVEEICAKLCIHKHYTTPEHGSMKYGYQKGYFNLPLKTLDGFMSEAVRVEREIYGFKFSAEVRKLF